VIPPARPSLFDLARAWIVVSTQSIGGGASTLFLMRRQMVERHRWVTHRQFLEDYALSKMSLGINLVALAGLIGSRVAGRRGIAVSLVALLVPAAAITLTLTIGYTLLRDDPLVRAALTGAGPAAAGMTAGIALTFMRQTVRRGWRRTIDYGYAAAVIGAGLFLGASPLIVIAAGVLVGAAFLRGETTRASGDPGS
jgi:chromate transporter